MGTRYLKKRVQLHGINLLVLIDIRQLARSVLFADNRNAIWVLRFDLGALLFSLVCTIGYGRRDDQSNLPKFGCFCL